MSTYFIRVSTSNERLIKVEADSRHEAEEAALAVFDDTDQKLSGNEAFAEDADPVDAPFVDDSIVVVQDGNGGVHYEFAADDPAGRGDKE